MAKRIAVTIIILALLFSAVAGTRYAYAAGLGVESAVGWTNSF